MKFIVCFHAYIVSSGAFSTSSVGTISSPRQSLVLKRENRRSQLHVTENDDNQVPFERENYLVTVDNEEEKDNGDAGEVSMAAGVFSLTKAMVGTGLLAMPGGLAATSDFPSMLWPANLLILVMGALSAYTFSLYGRLAFSTKSKTLDALWSNVFSYQDPETGTTKKGNTLPVSISNFLFCFGCCLCFLLVITDTLNSLTTLVASAPTPWWVSRNTIILSVVTAVLWPLCNLKSLKALAPVSIIGVLGCLVSTAFVVWRCPFVNKSSPYAGAAQFSTYNRLKGPAPLVLFSMGCVALMAHFSATDFLNAFTTKEANKNAESIPVDERRPIRRYSRMTLIGFALVALINAINLTFGFLTFGGKSAGIILNNYSASDWGAALSRLFTGVSVGGSFPILLSACRSSAFDLFRVSPQNGRKKLTAVLVAAIAGIAMLVKDAGFVVSFNGALTGTAILYIFPALMFLRWTEPLKAVQGWGRRLERAFCRFLVGFGAVAAVMGVATTIINSYFPHLLV